jgi:hypothetical protein
MTEKRLLRTDDWHEWLRTIPLEEFHKIFSAESLLRTLTVEDLVALSENEPLIEYIVEHVLPQAEDDAWRGGKMERPEAPIYAIIGKGDIIDVNDIYDLEGKPIRTRKAVGDASFKATEEYELFGPLSQLIHGVPDIRLSEVISEALDLSWNVIKLRRINPKYDVHLFNAIFAATLGWTRAQFLTLIVAKYHGRMFKGGKDLVVEETMVAQLIQQFGEPTVRHLNDLAKSAQKLVKKNLVAALAQVEADLEMEKLARGLGLLGQAFAHDASEE